MSDGGYVEYNNGGLIGDLPAHTLIRLHPDECLIRQSGECVRADHPTEASSCKR